MRRFICLFPSIVCFIILSGCGFSPVYGEKSAQNQSSVAAQLDKIYIDNIPDRSGQHLRNLLIDRFYTSGRPDKPANKLEIRNLTETASSLGIRKDATATRAQVQINADMILKNLKTGKIVYSRKLHTITSYNILDSQFTTLISEEDARKRGLIEMADTITRHLSLHFKRKGS